MPDRERFGPGDLVPAIGWWRRLGKRVEGLAIKALPPLFASWDRAGTRLDYLPRQRFHAIVTLLPDADGYTVQEARYVPSTPGWAPIAGGRTVKAWEYNGFAALPIGTKVEVIQSGIGDWRFWRAVSGVSAAPGTTCTPCVIPAELSLNFYDNYGESAPNDEYTGTLTWTPETFPWYDTNFSPPRPYFKPGYYYSDCQDVQLYGVDGEGGFVALGSPIAVRFFLACTATAQFQPTNKIAWFGWSFGTPFDGDHGAADCAAFDPETSTTPAGWFPMIQFSSNWGTVANCDPFELRDTYYNPFTDPPYLIHDIWIYQ